jgi:DNA-nicking Smr family endonuclease
MPGKERPTVAPPFDPQEYARESESRLRAALESKTVRRAAPSASPAASPSPSPRRDAVPILAVPLAELTTRALDHRRGFMVSLVDGTSTVETLLDLSGMPEREAMELLGELLAQGVLAIR